MLKCYQHKIDCCIITSYIKVILHKFYDNHKAITYNRYIKDKQKETEAYYMENQFTKEGSKRSRKEKQGNEKYCDSISKSSPINNYTNYKWIEFSY